MKGLFFIALFAAITTPLFCRTVEVATDWKFEVQTQSWTNKDTGLSMPTAVAGFKRDRAKPIDDDASSSFGYMGKNGTATLILEHRLAAGFGGNGDCTAAVRSNYLQVMHKSYGTTDSEKSFRLVYSRKGKRGNGVGTLCHFISFPTFKGIPAYSEVGVVLVGNFLIEYRATYINEAGRADLDRFLRAIGLKKF
jgi:hypothetical protein